MSSAYPPNYILPPSLVGTLGLLLKYQINDRFGPSGFNILSQLTCRWRAIFFQDTVSFWSDHVAISARTVRPILNANKWTNWIRIRAAWAACWCTACKVHIKQIFASKLRLPE